ncbi:hypothetical protein YYC_00666 [Plasmodium yoelii 17X]|uniref:Fam-a protein n=1 Tax=Plasmodium yoelii 17X TaxID=1323249 RepID=V7PY46_PLAYE|nr:hypothetical protein YYC_00666 [Plasmodium yoelii 17X]
MNKGYIKIALALLSVAGYMQNMAFATEYATSPNSSNETTKTQLLRFYNEIKKANQAKEAKQTSAIMSEALALAQKHAEHTNDYEEYSKEDDGTNLYFKKFKDTEIGKLEFTIPDADNYDDIINMLWDSNGAKNYDDNFIKGSIPRAYDPNLVIVQQRYKSPIGSLETYFNALAKKVEISKNKTAIVLVSSDMKDQNIASFIKYVNPIVESANSFKPDIDSEEDIRNAKLFKVYVNLVGAFIEKKSDCVKITYLSSLDLKTPPYIPQDIIRKFLASIMLNVVKLKDIFKKE